MPTVCVHIKNKNYRSAFDLNEKYKINGPQILKGKKHKSQMKILDVLKQYIAIDEFFMTAAVLYYFN